LASSRRYECFVQQRYNAPAAPMGSNALSGVQHDLATRAMNPKEVVQIVLETARQPGTRLPLLAIIGSLIFSG
jgi:hypothetical protein